MQHKIWFNQYLPTYSKKIIKHVVLLCKLEMEGLVCPALDSSSPYILLL